MSCGNRIFMKEFAAIRIISDRQILFYTESNDEGNTIHVLARTCNDINVNMSMGYDDREQDMWDVFENIRSGKLDASDFICQLLEFIENIEND
jgi:undecaprenyl pyrophosphate synthase